MKPAIPRFVAALGKGDDLASIVASKVLGLMGEPALDHLIGAARSEDASVRKSAAIGLGWARNGRGVEPND